MRGWLHITYFCDIGGVKMQWLIPSPTQGLWNLTYSACYQSNWMKQEKKDSVSYFSYLRFHRRKKIILSRTVAGNHSNKIPYYSHIQLLSEIRVFFFFFCIFYYHDLNQSNFCCETGLLMASEKECISYLKKVSCFSVTLLLTLQATSEDQINVFLHTFYPCYGHS